MKQDYPALLSAGIHTITLEDLKDEAVNAFPNSKSRGLLYNSLVNWIGQLINLKIRGTLWVNGSFCTQKENPDDIDVVLIIEDFPKEKSSQIELLLDNRIVKTTYQLDLYLLNDKHPKFAEMQSYWRGWFGFFRDGKTAKGFWEVKI